jgi:hypothetical protein
MIIIFIRYFRGFSPDISIKAPSELNNITLGAAQGSQIKEYYRFVDAGRSVA